MNENVPKFGELAQIEEDALLARLQAVRKTISHAGEKGRSLENEVAKLIISFLPAEYGISTGFIAYRTEEGVQLSSQLDIIVYDALRSGPIARLGTCDVFPLEAAYAYVEVKASLQSTSDNAGKYAENSIEACILKNKTLRTMRRRAYYVPVPGTINETKLQFAVCNPVRAFVFAFEPAGDTVRNPNKLAQRISEFSKAHGDVHLHGVYVGGSAFYSTVAVDPRTAKPEDWHHVCYIRDSLLSAFRLSLINSLSRFPRHGPHETPAIDLYNEKKIKWVYYPVDSVSSNNETSFDL